MSEVLRVASGAPNEARFGFCQATRVGGVIHVAGQVGKDNTTGDMVGAAGFTPRLRRALRNVLTAVGDAGGRAEDLVELRAHLDRHLAERWAQVLAEVRSVLAPGAPAVTAVQLAGLSDPDYQVEISATAITGEHQSSARAADGAGGHVVRRGPWIHVPGQPAGRGSTGGRALAEAIERLRGSLGAVGARLEDVVSTHLYVAGPLGPTDFDALCEAHRSAFGHARPAATLVLVDALPWPGVNAQVTAVAYAAL